MESGRTDAPKSIITGEGDAGQRGGPPGDLYVFLTVEADRQFRREGIDLYTDLSVDYLGKQAPQCIRAFVRLAVTRCSEEATAPPL